MFSKVYRFFSCGLSRLFIAFPLGKQPVGRPARTGSLICADSLFQLSAGEEMVFGENSPDLPAPIGLLPQPHRLLLSFAE